MPTGLLITQKPLWTTMRCRDNRKKYKKMINKIYYIRIFVIHGLWTGRGFVVIQNQYKHDSPQELSNLAFLKHTKTILNTVVHCCMLYDLRLRLLSYSMTRMTPCTADSFEVACEVSPWTEWHGCTEAFWCIKHVMETNDEIKGNFQCTKMESWPDQRSDTIPDEQRRHHKFIKCHYLILLVI